MNTKIPFFVALGLYLARQKNNTTNGICGMAVRGVVVVFCYFVGQCRYVRRLTDEGAMKGGCRWAQMEAVEALEGLRRGGAGGEWKQVQRSVEGAMKAWLCEVADPR